MPAGKACECAPYPQLVATHISSAGHHPVELFNDAVSGSRTTDVLAQLNSDTDTISHAAEASAVMIEVGANDIAESTECDTNIRCYEPELPEVTNNLEAIVSRVRQLAGHRVDVVLLDYWNVWLGGQYATALGRGYVAAATELTRELSAAIQSIAHTTNSIYVNLRTAFRGPDDDGDETGLLTSDGDHPNAVGQERIADAVTEAAAAA